MINSHLSLQCFFVDNSSDASFIQQVCSVLYVVKNAHKVAITYSQQLFPFLFGNENYTYVVKNLVNTVMLKKQAILQYWYWWYQQKLLKNTIYFLMQCKYTVFEYSMNFVGKMQTYYITAKLVLILIIWSYCGCAVQSWAEDYLKGCI